MIVRSRLADRAAGDGEIWVTQDQSLGSNSSPDRGNAKIDLATSSVSRASLASPKMAVVISCYNYETYVGRAIQSVLDQHCEDCELVVVDDGSTDGSWDAIGRFDVAAFKIPNSGQTAACMYGLDRSRAPFVLFLDADDEIKPGALRKIIDRLDPNVAKLQFPLTRIDQDGVVISWANPPLEDFRVRETLARRVLRTGVYRSPPTSGNVFRRDLCELAREARYDEAIDGVMLFAAPFFGDVVSVSEPLGFYRVHSRNKSGLGRMPNPAIFTRDIKRFVARLEHLRQVLRAQGRDRELVDPTTTYYYRSLQLSLAVASGDRPPLQAIPGLLRSIAAEPYSLKNKLMLMVFYGLASALPNPAATTMLAYRYGAGQRSLRNFIGGLFAPRLAGAKA